MAGSFDLLPRRLTIIFYDQGVGIPYSLPREHTMEKVMGVLSSLGLKDDDAGRIRAAMELSRSGTGDAHRGGGLGDIRGYTHLIPDGRLRILSGRGEYIYSPFKRDSKKRERLLTHKKPIGGTLIQWEATIPLEEMS